MGYRNHTAIRNLIRGGAALLALLLFACGPASERIVPALPTALPLAFDDGATDIEFSGICWWGDELFILPQYPGTGERGVYAIDRDSLARAIAEVEAGIEVTPLRPRRILTDPGDVPERIEAYDGLEALVIREGRCFALAEFGEGTDRWGSQLVSGSLERDGSVIRFDRLGQTVIGGPQVRENFTHEALVVTEDEVWVICELNGRRIVDRPLLARFDHGLQPLEPLQMPALEYRVTDATALDGRDRFWVLNIFWPPDVETVAPENATGPVERLVPLRREGDTIVRDLARPILDLRAGGDHPMHNWEGVARWGETGFLLVTDSYPENILAYVANPD
jgi:hypothetical protein